MAMAFVEGQVKSATASPAVTPAFTNAFATGQLVVVYIGYDAATSGLTTSVTDSKGNTYTQVPGFYTLGTSIALDCWYAVVTTGGAAPTVSVTFNDTANNANVVVQYFNGFTGTPTFDKKSTSSNASSTTATSGATTTTAQAVELIVGGAVHGSTVSAYTLGSGYTNLTQSSVASRQLGMESKLVAATGTQTATFTIAAARVSIGGVVTFYDAPSGITTTQTQTAVARITATTTNTQTGLARVTAATSATQTGVANITNNLTTSRTQTGIARIAATTGQAQTGVSRIATTTTRTQSGIARVQLITTQTQTGVSRIAITTSRTQTGVAKIAPVSYLTTFESAIDVVSDNFTYSATTMGEASNNTTAYRAVLDPAEWDNVTAIYFEVAMRSTGGGTVSARLQNITDGTAMATLTTASTTYVRQRTAITMPGSAKTVALYQQGVTGSNSIVDNARIIIQQGSGATKRTTYIPTASSDVTTGTTVTRSSYNHIWKYEASQYDGLDAVYWEFCGRGQTSGATLNMTLRDVTAASDVVTLSTSGTAIAIVRSTDIKSLLVDGHEYDVYFASNSTNTAGFGVTRFIIKQSYASKTQFTVDVVPWGMPIASTGGKILFDPTQYGSSTLAAYAEVVYQNTDSSTTFNTSGIDATSTTYTNSTVATVVGLGKGRVRNASQVTLPGSASEITAQTTAISGTGGETRAYKWVVNAQVGATVTTQNQTGVARIQATATQNQTGVARVTTTASQTQTGLARITAVVPQTQTGISRITAASSAAQTGISRVTATTSRTQTGIAKVTATTSQIQTGIARVSLLSAQTISGIARITATTTRTQTGVARVQTTVSQNQTGVSRVALVSSATQTGIARITATTTRTQTGLSRITATTSKTQTGVSRVTATSSQNQTGKAALILLTSQNQTGVARVTVTTSRNQTGVAMIGGLTTQNQTGVARIRITTSQLQTGISRIETSTTKAQTGLARVTAQVTKTQTGLARVIQVGSWNQTGVAAIATLAQRTQTGKSRIGLVTQKTQTGVARIRILSPDTNVPVNLIAQDVPQINIVQLKPGVFSVDVLPMIFIARETPINVVSTV